MPTISAKDEFNKDANMLLFMENEIPHPDEVYKFHHENVSTFYKAFARMQNWSETINIVKKTAKGKEIEQYNHVQKPQKGDNRYIT